MLNILWMIIAVIILFIFILLISGVKISLEYEKRGKIFKGCFKVLILKKIKIYSTNFPSDEEYENEEEIEEDTEQRDIKKILKLAKPCFDDFKIYIKSVLKSISITKLKNHLIFGLDDYADTGKYIGIIWAVLSVVNPIDENIQLSAEPSFNGSILDGWGENSIEIYPLKMIAPTIRLISKKNVRTFIRGVLDER